MAQSISRKRPWFAALLAALVTGLGHLYLRRVYRAVGWLAVSLAVSLFFVDPAAVEKLMAGGVSRDVLVNVAPSVLVTGLSVIDAYLLARTQLVRSRSPVTGGDADGDPPTCSHCGKDLDPDLEFCHWCTNPIDDLDRERDDATRDQTV